MGYDQARFIDTDEEGPASSTGFFSGEEKEKITLPTLVPLFVCSVTGVASISEIDPVDPIVVYLPSERVEDWTHDLANLSGSLCFWTKELGVQSCQMETP